MAIPPKRNCVLEIRAGCLGPSPNMLIPAWLETYIGCSQDQLAQAPGLHLIRLEVLRGRPFKSEAHTPELPTHCRTVGSV